MELIESFRALVRSALGLSTDRKTPSMAHVAPYRARVVACASDGSTVDVQPDDDRLEPMQKVPVVTGIPHFTAVVQAGSVVWIGWEAGDPAKPRAIPAWESATVSSMVIAGGTKNAARVDDLVVANTNMAAWITSVQAICSALATLASSPAPVAPTDFGKITTNGSKVKIG